MRRLLISALGLVALGACTAAPPPAANTTTSNANLAKPSTSAAFSNADIENQEKQIWDTLKGKKHDEFASMLADDYIEVYPGGVNRKQDTVEQVKKFEPTDIQFSDWKVTKLGPDAALVTYTVNTKGKFDGKELPPNPVRGSSVWVRRDGKWLGIFHQETEVSKAQPPATAKAAASPSAAGSTAKPAPATSSDAVANEKAVWAALKEKNYDGFAAVLADDSIDVEASAVFDKNGIIQAVRSGDFSETTADNYRALDVGPEAKLVTYTSNFKVNGRPAQAQESTIWVNRGGKWLAVFHQATEAQPGS
jgi:hypothetical protein